MNFIYLFIYSFIYILIHVTINDLHRVDLIKMYAIIE